MDKPLNIRRIAELAKCSPSTVSRVLSGRKTNIPISEETRQRVLEVCHKLDYQPSIHALRFFSRQAGVIGFLKASGEMTDDDNLPNLFLLSAVSSSPAVTAPCRSSEVWNSSKRKNI